METTTKIEPPRPPIPDDNPMLAWVSLIHAATHLRDGLERKFLAELGISGAEQDLLKQIAVNDGALTLTALARRIFFSKAGITKMLDRLEKQGLLKREPDPADRRALRAVLTPKGQRTLATSNEILSEFVETHFAAHLKPSDLNKMNQALRALLEGLGAWEGQTAHLKGAAHE